MKIFVKAHTRSRKARVLKKDAGHYEIWVNEPPEAGRANRAILEALSEELEVPKSRLSIVSGQTSKNKVISVNQL